VITVDDLRAVVWGLGAMGGGIARVLTEREGVRVVGAIDSNPELVGKDLGQVLGLESNYGVEVVAEPGKVLSNSRAQVCIVATSSFVEDVQEQLVAAIKAGCNVISIAEEMADPAASHLETAAMLDRLARQHGVTVLGTGINPGFVLDSLIIVLTAACTNVERIRARRINDLGPFGPTVMRTQGVGTTPEQFEQGLADGTIVGHVGFAESLGPFQRRWDGTSTRYDKKGLPSSPEKSVRGITSACLLAAWPAAGTQRGAILKDAK